jgi:pyrimidine-nucleoside phosphorylase
MSNFDPVSLIAAKRDGDTLSAAALRALVDGHTEGKIPDYQMSAFLMAAYLNGLSALEAAALTDAMLHSGTRIDLSDIAGTKVGKHSTGGVGDKVSPILVPVVSSCGVPVAKLSGRGLGHTGGTIDKLESIPDFRTDLSVAQYRRQVADLGEVIAGQTGTVTPADKKIYALRDVTATVDSIPLIAASIMSKKLAEGNDALVLDVKCGRGAFMKTDADARALAETLVAIGAEHDMPVVAVMTNMNVPLGRAVGNWPEIREGIACLHGEHADSALMQIVRRLAGEMVALGGRAETPEVGRAKARDAIESGAALDQFRALVAAQGGNPAVVGAPDGRPNSGPIAEVTAPPGADGYVDDLDALSIGRAAVALGAGRQTKDESVDPVAGHTARKKPGGRVQRGDVLARLHAGGAPDLDAVRAAVRDAYAFADSPPTMSVAVKARYDPAGWTDLSKEATGGL